MFCLILTACGGGTASTGTGGTTGGTTTSPPPVTMLDTKEHGSITLNDYIRRRNQLASQYRSDSTFTNQYGLGSIKADVGLANLNLKRGSSAADRCIAAPGQSVSLVAYQAAEDPFNPGERGSDHRQAGNPNKCKRHRLLPEAWC